MQVSKQRKSTDTLKLEQPTRRLAMSGYDNRNSHRDRDPFEFPSSPTDKGDVGDQDATDEEACPDQHDSSSSDDFGVPACTSSRSRIDGDLHSSTASIKNRAVYSEDTFRRFQERLRSKGYFRVELTADQGFICRYGACSRNPKRRTLSSTRFDVGKSVKLNK